jgi:THO complex subunit 4
MSTTPTTNASSPAAGNKIMISNLPYDVNEAQIKVSIHVSRSVVSHSQQTQELFTQTIGPIREVIITYDSNGKSKGIASVTFNKASDSQKAYQQYNNRLIDGS